MPADDDLADLADDLRSWALEVCVMVDAVSLMPYPSRITIPNLRSKPSRTSGGMDVRSASDRALADISFLIADQPQGRGLGTLLMGAIAIAARRNGIARFCADVLAENAPMRAILAHAGIKWESAHAGVMHGYVAVPDPGKFGITPGTAAVLAAVVDEMKIQL